MAGRGFGLSFPSFFSAPPRCLFASRRALSCRRGSRGQKTGAQRTAAFGRASFFHGTVGISAKQKFKLTHYQKDLCNSGPRDLASPAPMAQFQKSFLFRGRLEFFSKKKSFLICRLQYPQIPVDPPIPGEVAVVEWVMR